MYILQDEASRFICITIIEISKALWLYDIPHILYLGIEYILFPKLIREPAFLIAEYGTSFRVSSLSYLVSPLHAPGLSSQYILPNQLDAPDLHLFRRML